MDRENFEVLRCEIKEWKGNLATAHTQNEDK